MKHKNIVHKEILENEKEDRKATVKSQTSKRFHCEYCERKFNKAETYSKHKKQAHQETLSDNSIKDIGKNSQSLFKTITPFQRMLRSYKKNFSTLEPINWQGLIRVETCFDVIFLYDIYLNCWSNQKNHNRPTKPPQLQDVTKFAPSNHQYWDHEHPQDVIETVIQKYLFEPDEWSGNISVLR